ncbi:hypothetical protein DFQ28_008288 [Apophysomyces sp. BC1034]|nr:hypothetical protein DFQ30_007266 [Apophysomyces sp. BC1015]KAG0181894.1 hypothetical protein DFQ29_006560 [Apophysomyces sp. BC1021]KAG0192665.1 hypothetical protein DFQ28_008288 [Apophysomyces sp. BC1034]
MDDDIIEYVFDTIDNFYAELDDLLRLPSENVEKTTTQYLRFLIRFQKEFVQTPTEIAQVTYRFLDSAFFLEHSTTILSHILHVHSLSSTEPDELVLAYSLLLYAGREDPRWMKYVISDARQNKQNRLLRKLLGEIKEFLGGYPCMSVALALVFEMCKVAKLRHADFDILSPALLDFLLNLVESTRGDAEESFNYDVIRLILVFNEQFMMTQHSSNLVLEVLTQRIDTTNTFSANLIFMLNRSGTQLSYFKNVISHLRGSDDVVVQLLILKLLYGVFTHPALYEYFYTNDLYVLIDIILREVCDLGEEREAEALRDAYLRVLKPLLINTQLHRTPYKQSEIHRTLCSVITPAMHKPVEPSTRRLVQRILEEWWEKVCDQPVAPILGVDVKNAVIESSQGSNAVARSAVPSPIPSFASLSISEPSPSGTDAKSPANEDVSLPSADLNRGVVCAGA